MASSNWARSELEAAAVAIRLQMSRERVVRLIQSGQLAGRRDEHRGWLARRLSVEKLERVLEARRRMAGKGGRHG